MRQCFPWKKKLGNGTRTVGHDAFVLFTLALVLRGFVQAFRQRVAVLFPVYAVVAPLDALFIPVQALPTLARAENETALSGGRVGLWIKDARAMLIISMDPE